MDLRLGEALRLFGRAGPPKVGAASGGVALVGAGGKTAGVFMLARESPVPALVTSTTHFGAWQTQLADRHIIAESSADVRSFEDAGVTLITGALGPDERLQPVASDILLGLHEESMTRGRLLLVEADGARQKPLKAPAESEPAIPAFITTVVVVAGMSGLGKPLSAAEVHRPEIFSALSGLNMGETISGEALVRVLVHGQGGLKNIPPEARHSVLLNQADTPGLQSEASGIAHALLNDFDSVVVASLKNHAIHAAHETCAGVILAAGAATRFGEPKQLLDWRGRPFVRAVAETAIAAGLSPVIVVTGAAAESVESALRSLPVVIVRNAHWRDGQASSIHAGVAAVPPAAGAALFLLSDQPQVTPEIMRALVETHATALQPIVAPLIRDEHRGNPVLFDRSTFADLLALRGDVGGRSIFSKHPVHYRPWHDGRLLLDVDTPEDYRRLLEGDVS
jgi:molybdenum cofactor cytidylyltransferase